MSNENLPIEVIGDKIVVVDITKEETTDSGIIVKRGRESIRKGVVVKVGDEVEDIEQGQIIIYVQFKNVKSIRWKADIARVDYSVIREGQVILKYDDDIKEEGVEIVVPEVATPIRGKVLVRPVETTGEAFIGNTKIVVDTSFNEEANAVIKATVVSNPLDTDGIETEIGDSIYCHYNAISMAEKQGHDFMVGMGDDEFYRVLLIDYNNIYLAQRGDKVIMMNDFVLIEEVPIDEEVVDKIGSIYIPDSVKDKYSGNMGIVRATNSKSRVKEGDKVIISNFANIPIENALYRTLLDTGKTYYRVRNRDIDAIFTGKSIRTVSKHTIEVE